MKITGIDVFATKYTTSLDSFRLSGGRTFPVLDGVIVRITTDEGVTGWGEQVSAPTYMVAFQPAVVEAIRFMAPALIGLDPRGGVAVYARMDEIIMGHGYAKGAIDMACWDIAGKAGNAPLSVLLGGTFRTEIPLFNWLPMDTPERMLARCQVLYDQGFRRLQVKVGGGDLREDIQRIETIWPVAQHFDIVDVDANAYWTPREALEFLRALDHLPFMIEQPCRDLATNVSVRRRTNRAMQLDESLDSLAALEEAYRQEAFDSAMLKLSRFGGVTPLKVARDNCVRWGKTVIIEDIAGGAIVNAVSAHLAASTPPRNLLAGSLIGQFWKEQYGTGPVINGATFQVPEGPGIGVEVDVAALGEPVVVVRE